MEEGNQIIVSRFLLEQLTGRKERPEDYQGTGARQTYNVALRYDGEYHVYTIVQAETAAQALLLGLEKVLLNSSLDKLQGCDSLDVVVVRESA